MVTVEKRDECFADFLKSMSLRAIAGKHKLSRRTLERWSVADHWVIRRNRAWNEIKEEIARKHISREVHSDVLASEAIYHLIKCAHAERLAVYKGELPRKALKFGSHDLIQFAKALQFANIADRMNALGVEVKTEIDNGTFDPKKYSGEKAG